jgi:hypothetical protein
LRRLPAQPLDGYVGLRKANDVERIDFASSTGGGCGSGLNDYCRASAEFVTLCRVTGVADVQMAGEKHIGSARGKLPDCHT